MTGFKPARELEVEERFTPEHVHEGDQDQRVNTDSTNSNSSHNNSNHSHNHSSMLQDTCAADSVLSRGSDEHSAAGIEHNLSLSHADPVQLLLQQMSAQWMHAQQAFATTLDSNVAQPGNRHTRRQAETNAAESGTLRSLQIMHSGRCLYRLQSSTSPSIDADRSSALIRPFSLWSGMRKARINLHCSSRMVNSSSSSSYSRNNNRMSNDIGDWSAMGAALQHEIEARSH